MTGVQTCALPIFTAPQQTDAWTGRGFAHFHLKQWEAAITDFSRAIELAPQTHTNWFHRGLAYINLGQWEKAAADFSKATELSPDHTDSWYQRGLVQAQLQRPAEAVTYLRRAVEQDVFYAGPLKTDDKLDPIRATEDFKKLLTELEGKDKKGSR